MDVVIDINIIVSALWSPNGAPAEIISRMLSGSLSPCYDYRIIEEYREVLLRPKFLFTEEEVNSLLDFIIAEGKSVTPARIDIPFLDESDKKFFEMAKFCRAPLITGNSKHYPKDKLVVSIKEFLSRS